MQVWIEDYNPLGIAWLPADQAVRQAGFEFQVGMSSGSGLRFARCSLQFALTKEHRN
jgi:hypothetical protein